jgi:hypothetical protein
MILAGSQKRAAIQSRHPADCNCHGKSAGAPNKPALFMAARLETLPGGLRIGTASETLYFHFIVVIVQTDQAPG